jgi:hypothetical protein
VSQDIPAVAPMWVRSLVALPGGTWYHLHGAMIDEIREKFRQRQYEYSLHAVDRSIEKRITRREVEDAVASGDVIEDYPTDKYGPSCLIFGLTAAGRPLHIQCMHPVRTRIKIITLYEPDPAEWIGYRTRKSP